MSNSIGSLRFLGAMDWHEFVETMSVVDQTLGEDPGGYYHEMDFTTRDRYRHVIEEIAKSSGLSEAEVARKAIRLSQEGAAERGRDDRAAHVGYYLIDRGLMRLKDRQGCAYPFSGPCKTRSAGFLISCTSARSCCSRR